jgi:hypothetical protein
MVKQIDSKWWESQYLLFKNEGHIGLGKVTYKYTIFAKLNNGFLGIVKWHIPWRRYCLFPINGVFEYKCLRDIADFCEDRTKFQMKLAAEKRALKPVKMRRKVPKGSDLPNYLGAKRKGAL